MKKIALLLALLMLLCCTGCGEKEEAPAGQEATGTAQQETTGVPGEVEEEDVCPQSDDGKHQYEEELVAEATCTDSGLMMYTCIACNKSVTNEIPARGHDGTGASCEEPSICSICWEVAEEAWGHEDEGGVCKHCGTPMDEIATRPVITFPESTESEEEVDGTEGEEIETTGSTVAAE